jgi:hypothetical protein
MAEIDGTEVMSDKTKYSKDYHTSYYRSYGCTESSEYASRTSGEYLAKYGRINNEMLSELCEYIARVLLDQYFDSGSANSDYE